MRGRRDPSTAATGREKVRTIGAVGASVSSAAGRASTSGPRAFGNQVILAEGGNRSHNLGTPETRAVPAPSAPEASTPSGTTRLAGATRSTRRGPDSSLIEMAATGAVKAISTG